MSKKILKGANQDQIDTYSDTFKGFSPFLRKKILIIPENFSSGKDRKYFEQLQNYMSSENPKYIVEAIKLNKDVLGADFHKQAFDITSKIRLQIADNISRDEKNKIIIKNKKFNLTDVPHYFVVWETINFWLLHDNNDEVRYHFKRILNLKGVDLNKVISARKKGQGTQFLRDKDQYDYTFTDYSLVHIRKHKKRSKS